MTTAAAPPRTVPTDRTTATSAWTLLTPQAADQTPGGHTVLAVVRWGGRLVLTGQGPLAPPTRLLSSQGGVPPLPLCLPEALLTGHGPPLRATQLLTHPDPVLTRAAAEIALIQHGLTLHTALGLAAPPLVFCPVDGEAGRLRDAYVLAVHLRGHPAGDTHDPHVRQLRETHARAAGPGAAGRWTALIQAEARLLQALQLICDA